MSKHSPRTEQPGRTGRRFFRATRQCLDTIAESTSYIPSHESLFWMRASIMLRDYYIRLFSGTVKYARLASWLSVLPAANKCTLLCAGSWIVVCDHHINSCSGSAWPESVCIDDQWWSMMINDKRPCPCRALYDHVKSCIKPTRSQRSWSVLPSFLNVSLTEPCSKFHFWLITQSRKTSVVSTSRYHESSITSSWDSCRNPVYNTTKMRPYTRLRFYQGLDNWTNGSQRKGIFQRYLLYSNVFMASASSLALTKLYCRM